MWDDYWRRSSPSGVKWVLFGLKRWLRQYSTSNVLSTLTDLIFPSKKLPPFQHDHTMSVTFTCRTVCSSSVNVCVHVWTSFLCDPLTQEDWGGDPVLIHTLHKHIGDWMTRMFVVCHVMYMTHKIMVGVSVCSIISMEESCHMTAWTSHVITSVDLLPPSLRYAIFSKSLCHGS